MRTQADTPDASADSAEMLDATALLMSDHRTVEALFEEFEGETARSRKVAIANRICDELTVHALIEEEIFYPQALGMLPKDDADLIWEASVEHGTLEGLIDVIRKADGSEDQFSAYVTVLKEYVQHHVKEEEESMFPKVRESGADLESLGALLGERKAELLEEMQGGNTRRRSSGGGGGASKRSGGQRSGAGGGSKTAKRASR